MAGPGFQQAVEYQRGDFGVGAGPVRLAVVQAEVGRQRGQVVFGNRRQEYGRQVPGVVVPVGQREMVGAQKAQVKGHVVADDGQVANKVCELVGHPVERGRPFDLRRADRGQLLDKWRYLAPRVDERLVAVENFAAPKSDGPELYDGVRVGVEPGGFQVNADKLVLEGVEPGPA